MPTTPDTAELTNIRDALAAEPAFVTLVATMLPCPPFVFRCAHCGKPHHEHVNMGTRESWFCDPMNSPQTFTPGAAGVACPVCCGIETSPRWKFATDGCDASGTVIVADWLRWSCRCGYSWATKTANESATGKDTPR